MSEVLSQITVNTRSVNLQRMLITATVMLVAILEVLDMTIVNVSLPHMMGSLGANTEQITWVLTSYIVAAAILMPMTGLLVSQLGQKRLLLMNIIGFGVASALCGTATSLTTMVMFRTLQGLFGASLVPLAQTILRDVYPVEEHTKAMAIWGIGIMAAPVLGPTLGGYITETYNWRWVFYLNIPVCILCFFMAVNLVKETPKKLQKVDWKGIALLVVGVGALQIFLDQGSQKDWFESRLIISLAFVAVFALAYFIIRGLKNKDNIINLDLFLDRNFAIGTVGLGLFVTAMFGVIAIQPLMLENLMGYTAIDTGMIMAPRGIAGAIAMAMVTGLSQRFSLRSLIIAGLIFSASGSYMMCSFTLNTSWELLCIANAIQGLGMGFVFVPITTLGFSTLNKETEAEASGLFSFGRSLGSSIGISILSTIISRHKQINWQQLGSHISVYNQNVQAWLQNFSDQFGGANPYAVLTQELAIQSGMKTFIDAYLLVAIGFLCIIPLIFLMRENRA